MDPSKKLFLALVIFLYTLQIATAYNHPYGSSFLETIKFDLSRKYAELERDLERENANSKHKLLKESIKLGKKSTKSEAVECVTAARIEAEEQYDEKYQEAVDCLKEIKDNMEGDIKDDASFAEILSFRNKFRNQLNLCKRTARTEYRTIQNLFSAAAKQCIL